MLTPEYYLAPDNDAFRNEVNKFVHYARLESFQHPLENQSGEIPEYSTPLIGEFGAVKGNPPDQQHHPAIDMHVGSNETNVELFATYDGYVQTYKDAQMYRDYLSITKNIEDEFGNVLGKMVTIYGHLDLGLDEADGIFLNGQTVNQGDLISTHLYLETVGGPHLHFEIRYYRTYDVGDEYFYGSFYPYLTEPSAGISIYGLWDPNVGYGYANPVNHYENSYQFIVVSENILNIDYPENSEASIELNSNTDWSVDIDQNWLTVDILSGSNNATLTFTANENATSEARTAQVTISGTNATSQVVTVNQYSEFSAVSEQFDEYFSIYPNPTFSKIFIKNLVNSSRISIFDINGRLVLSKNIEIENSAVDVSNLQSGFYNLKIENETENIALKFLKL